MGLQRTIMSSSHNVQDVGTFIIHPEVLTEDEIEYELIIRGELIAGNRRELTAKLRSMISQEQKAIRQKPIAAYSVPSEELQYCENQIPVLRELLDTVDPEISTQNRFMSKFLHLEGRLNRIPKTNTAHDITGGVYATNEKLSEFYNEFCAKITGFRKTKKTRQENAQEQGMLSLATGGVELIDKSALQFEGELKNKNAAGAKPKSKNTHEWTQNEYDLRYRLPERRPMNNNNTRIESSNRRFPIDNHNPNRNSEAGNIQNQSEVFIINSQSPRTNNRENVNRCDRNVITNPGLSAHFRSNDQSLSHIPYQNDSMFFPPMTSSDINGNINQYLHENFGRGMRNSMPLYGQHPRALPHNN